MTKKEESGIAPRRFFFHRANACLKAVLINIVAVLSFQLL